MDYVNARKSMVEGQLLPNKITDPKLIQIFHHLPREIFVDVAHKKTAYTDSFTLISSNRYLIPPLATARIIQELNTQKTDKVLVVAAGSGYSAAIFSQLSQSVIAIEDDHHLFEMAKRSLIDASCKSVKILEKAPEKGLEKEAPFDIIFIDAPIEFIPETLWEQLKSGGKLAALEMHSQKLSTASIYTKKGQRLKKETLFETSGIVLENFKKSPTFEF